MSIDDVRPELLDEWDYSKNTLHPEEISAYSPQKAYWICSKDPHHKWMAIIGNRTKGSNCPICSNKLVCSCGCNSFAQKFPELAEEWHLKNESAPWEYTPGSGKKVWWQCKKDNHHEWIDSIAHRTGSSRGCPICSNYRICKCGCNSLATRRPDLAKEWDYELNKKTPEQVPYASGLRYAWICSKDPHHKWSTTLDNRYHKNAGCPFCVNQRVCPCGCNSFQTRFPELLKEWDYAANKKSPAEYTYQSTEKVCWVCSKNNNHKWKTAIYYRTSSKQQTGCPFCCESQGEKRIIKILDMLGIVWEREKRFEYCKHKQKLPFDIYLPLLNALLEFDGLHHFKKGRYFDTDFVIRDVKKTIYARQRHFLRIAYTEISDIVEIVEEFVTAIINRKLKPGFYYNYTNTLTDSHILAVYKYHESADTNNLEDVALKILQAISSQ